jgi:hypothetical protein
MKMALRDNNWSGSANINQLSLQQVNSNNKHNTTNKNSKKRHSRSIIIREFDLNSISQIAKLQNIHIASLLMQLLCITELYSVTPKLTRNSVTPFDSDLNTIHCRTVIQYPNLSNINYELERAAFM